MGQPYPQMAGGYHQQQYMQQGMYQQQAYGMGPGAIPGMQQGDLALKGVDARLHGTS